MKNNRKPITTAQWLCPFTLRHCFRINVAAITPPMPHKLPDTALAEKIYQMKAGSATTWSDQFLSLVDPVTALRSVPGFHRFPAYVDEEH